MIDENDNYYLDKFLTTEELNTFVHFLEMEYELEEDTSVKKENK